MKKRFSEEQIATILKEAEGGATVLDVCRKHNVTPNTFYLWRKKYAGMEVTEVREMKRLVEENNRLKRLLADRDLEVDALKDVLSKNF